MTKRQFSGTGGTGPSRLAALAAGMIVAVTGMTISEPASAQITGTRHNLGSLGTGVNKFSGTAEICVFCHTPHGADLTAIVPLWNRSLTATTYTTYDSLGTSTLQGKVAPVGSVSIACMSCHDGTQAMNTVLNAPGSGLAGSANWTGGTWSGANQTNGKLIGVANLGADLRNDHPVGIQYAGGGYTTTALTGPGTDPDFQPAKNTIIGGNLRVWWVDSETTPNNARNKTDMMLYTRAPGAGSGYTGQTLSEPFVECATCHDPHTSTTMFLRTVNDNSRVCLSCHIK